MATRVILTITDKVINAATEYANKKTVADGITVADIEQVIEEQRIELHKLEQHYINLDNDGSIVLRNKVGRKAGCLFGIWSQIWSLHSAIKGRI